MKIPNNTNPALVASSDQTRYILTHVCFHDGLIMATDGRLAMVAIAEKSADDDARSSVLINQDVMRAATKKRKGKLFQNEIKVDSDSLVVRNDLVSETIYRDAPNGDYPSIKKAFPDASKQTHVISINSKFLAKLAAAMGDDAISIHINMEGFGGGNQYAQPILATSKSKDVIGCIMPMRSETISRLSENHALKKLLETSGEAIKFGKPTP